MKTKDIIVGRFYKHSGYSNFEYLGCCKSSLTYQNPKHFLVITKGNGYVGRQVSNNRNKKGNENFWSGFYLIGN